MENRTICGIEFEEVLIPPRRYRRKNDEQQERKWRAKVGGYILEICVWYTQATTDLDDGVVDCHVTPPWMDSRELRIYVGAGGGDEDAYPTPKAESLVQAALHLCGLDSADRTCGNCRWLHPGSPQFYSTKEPQVPWCWATPHHEQRGQTWPACALWEGKAG